MTNEARYYCWPIYLVTFRPWECENSCPVSVGRVVRTQQLHFSGDLNFQEFDFWFKSVHSYVWEGKPSHIRDRRLKISLWSSVPFFSVLLSIIWFIGRVTYCLFRPLPAPSSSALRSILGGNRLVAVCAAERSDSECHSEFLFWITKGARPLDSGEPLWAELFFSVHRCRCRYIVREITL